MGQTILYKDGKKGLFSDESIRLANPLKHGWEKAIMEVANIPSGVTEFLNKAKEPEQPKEPEKLAPTPETTMKNKPGKGVK